MATKTIKKRTQTSAKVSQAFTDEEKAAMRDHVQEVQAATRRGPQADIAQGESDVLAKIATLPAMDRAMGERIHAIIKANAPVLTPKLWYGMPAYAKDGKIVCFFQSGQKFKTRYATLGFNDSAHLDEGGLWPVAFALQKLTGAEEAKIVAIVKKAVS